jgi:hypothetical protein
MSFLQVFKTMLEQGMDVVPINPVSYTLTTKTNLTTPLVRCEISGKTLPRLTR